MARKKSGAGTSFEDPITRELRSAIADDGRTLYGVARDAGVDEALIRRFMSRERSVSLRTADRLATALGLKLVRKGRPKPVVGPAIPDGPEEVAG